MKLLKLILITFILFSVNDNIFAQENSQSEKFVRYNEAYQFVFFSVLEGLYRDGASQADVNRILMKQSEEHGYEHFIYSCEICTSTKFAVQLYKNRPAHTGYKGANKNRSFGPGLSEEFQNGLNSENVEIRLETIHKLVSKWIKDRMNSMNLTDEKRTSLYRAFEDGREQGMRALESFKKSPELIKAYAPGYANLDECAICNAATNMDFK